MVEHLEAARVQESAPVSEAGKFQSYVEGINSLSQASKAETGTKDILPGLTITKEVKDMGNGQQLPSDGASSGRNSMEGPKKAQTFGDSSEKPGIIKHPKPGDKDVPANVGSSTDNTNSSAGSGDKGDTGNVGGSNDECFQPLLPKGDGKGDQYDYKDLKSVLEKNGLEYKPPSKNSDEEFIKEKFRQIHEGSHESVKGDPDADAEATNDPKLTVPDGALSVQDSKKAETDWIKQKFDQFRSKDKDAKE